jgi:hypothetical protein
LRAAPAAEQAIGGILRMTFGTFHYLVTFSASLPKEYQLREKESNGTERQFGEVYELLIRRYI